MYNHFIAKINPRSYNQRTAVSSPKPIYTEAQDAAYFRRGLEPLSTQNNASSQVLHHTFFPQGVFMGRLAGASAQAKAMFTGLQSTGRSCVLYSFFETSM
jgi:hypothetical protein